MARSRLAMASDDLTPDAAEVMLKVFRCLEEATTEVVGKFPNDLITVSVLAYLVRVAPDSASTDVEVVEVSPILVHHQGELQRDYPGWDGS